MHGSDSNAPPNFLARLAVLYKEAVELVVGLLPLALAGYVFLLQNPPQIYLSHVAHEAINSALIVMALFAAGMTFRCFQRSGEPSLRYLTLGLLSYALISLPHVVMTPVADSYSWLFRLYGPAARVAMAAFLLEAVTRYGEPAEPLARRRDVMSWAIWLVAVAVVALGISLFGALPLGNDPHLRAVVDGLAVVMALAGVVAIRWCRLASGLVSAYQAAMLMFASSSVAFMLSAQWTHLWWLAHIIYIVGFLALSHAIVRVLLTAGSFGGAQSEEEMAVRLRGAESAAAASQEAANQMHLLFESSPFNVVVTSPEGRILFCNQRHADLLGLPPEEVTGKDASFFHGEPALRQTFIDGMFASGSGVTAEVECIHADGEPRRHLVTWMPLIYQGRPAVVAWGFDPDQLRPTPVNQR